MSGGSPPWRMLPALTNLYLLDEDLTAALNRAGERLVAAGQDVAMPQGTPEAFVDQVGLYVFEANLQRTLALNNAVEYYNMEGDAEFQTLAQSAFDEAMASDRRVAAALDPMLDAIAGVTLPATLLPDVTTDYAVTSNSAYGVLVDIRNVGDVVAEQVAVALVPGKAFGAPDPEISLGDIPGGETRSHLFYLDPPAMTTGRVAFAQISVTSSNAESVFSQFMMQMYSGGVP